MNAVDELHHGQERICELIRVLSTLSREESLIGTRTYFELLKRLASEVEHQFTLEERNIYSRMLVHEDARVKATASRFLSGEREIKRLFGDYAAKWCQQNAARQDTNAFVRDTETMFRLLLDRMKNADRDLYPVAAQAAHSPGLAAGY